MPLKLRKGFGVCTDPRRFYDLSVFTRCENSDINFNSTVEFSTEMPDVPECSKHIENILHFLKLYDSAPKTTDYVFDKIFSPEMIRLAHAVLVWEESLITLKQVKSQKEIEELFIRFNFLVQLPTNWDYNLKPKCQIVRHRCTLMDRDTGEGYYVSWSKK